MLKYINKRAFASIVEVVITAIIFMLAATGMYSSISNLRPETEISSEKLAAAYEAQALLSELRTEVAAPTWDTGNLQVGSHNAVAAPYTFVWEVENANYLGTAIPARKLTLTVTY